MSGRIFSLDDGRGNMAAYYGDLDVPNPQFKPLMPEGGEPSGFARLKDGSIALGKRIYSVNPAMVKSYHINFKAIPTQENRAVMVEYAKAWRELLMKRNPAAFAGGEDAWFIGIPTGWRKKKIVDEYRSIFQEAGYPNPIIVPESNAAMVHAQKSYGAMARVNPEIGALCMDFGAYSNDATYILPGKVSSCGGYTGAALIEQMLLRINMQQRCKLSKKLHNTPELVEAVQGQYAQDANFRRYLTLQARQLKEMYFNHLFDGRNYPARDLTLSVPLDEEDPVFSPFVEAGDDYFVLYCNDALIKAILEEHSIREILGEEFAALPQETQAEIGDKSWADCLRAFLRNTLAICPKLAQAGKTEAQGDKPIVILTGGAARMPLIEDLVYTELPNAEVYKDESPMETIARGLWLFGPDKLRALKFDSAFQELLEEQDAQGNPVYNVILSHAHDVLGQDLLTELAVRPANCIVDAANAWKSYAYDSSQIVPHARQAFKAYYDQELREKIPEKGRTCKQYIVDEVNKRFKNLLEESGVNRTAFKAEELDITYIDVFLKDILLGDKIYTIIDQQIAEEDALYSKLPNPGKLNLLSRRSEPLSEASDALNQRNKGWRESLYKDLKTVYDSDAIYRPFALECLIELNAALERQKKELLGDLILEDVADEE